MIRAKYQYPDSTVAEQETSVNGLVTAARSRSNLTAAFAYDGLRRRVSVTDPRTGTSTMAYHTAAGKIGLPASETDAAGNATSYEYDTASGRLLWKKNALNHYTRYAYNARGQQTRVWGDAEYPVEYGYDQYGQKTTMTTFRGGSAWNGESWPNPAPAGDTTTWTFDAASGAVTAKTYADGHGPAYTYTLDGKPATRTWARADANNDPLTTTYSYDDATGELIGIDYSDSTPDIAYTYTRTGQPATITDVVGTRTFAYNAQLQEVSETISGGLYSKTLTRSYTTAGMKGRKLGLAVGGVANYTYSYDSYGRLNKITTPAGDFDYTRLANSDLVAQMTRPNGVTTTWTYEQNRDLITQVQNGGISTYGYTNDAIGRRTPMSRSGSAHPTPDTISYSYNDRSEVTGATSNNIPSYTYTYSYDPIGNRTSASEAGVPWTYATNNLNQYTSATEDNVQLTFTYDLDGSMTYRPVDANSGWTQVWNGENRMVETYKGDDRLTFQYDYMGRRVEKKVYDGQALTTHLKFVYDGFKLVEELDALNGDAPLRRYTWQPDDVGLDVVLQVTDVPNAAHSFHLHDANKNVMQLATASGALATAHAYSPFGTSVNTTPQTFGFSSEVRDCETKLSYYNYRYLSPLFGRWINYDLIFHKDGENCLAYIQNNSLSRYDSLGLFGSGGLVCLQYGRKWGIIISVDPSTGHRTMYFGMTIYCKRYERILGHKDFANLDECGFDYTKEDRDLDTRPENPITGIGGHFRPHYEDKKLNDHGTLADVEKAIKSCSASDFQKYMHQAQDFYTHYNKGYRAWQFTDRRSFPPGHLWDGSAPDYDEEAWEKAQELTKEKLEDWKRNCCIKCPKNKCIWVPKSSGECAE